MDAPSLLSGCFPPAIRERWGDELEHEIAAAGARSWPGTAYAAAVLWLHPSDWPEPGSGRNRRVLAVATAALVLSCTLVLRGSMHPATLRAALGSSVSAGWLTLLVGGVLCLAPAPGSWRAAAGAARAASRVLIAPAGSAAAIWIAGSSGTVDRVPPPAHAVLLVWYWGTLAFACRGVCAFVSRLAGDLPAASAPRTRWALTLVSVALAGAAGQTLLACAHGRHDLAAAGCLTALALVATTAARDLHAARVHRGR